MRRIADELCYDLNEIAHELGVHVVTLRRYLANDDFRTANGKKRLFPEARSDGKTHKRYYNPADIARARIRLRYLKHGEFKDYTKSKESEKHEND